MKQGQFDNPSDSSEQEFNLGQLGANRRPGSALPETQLWQPRLENGKETGVVDPKGNFIKLDDGESFVINKGEGGDYEAVAIGKSGERRIVKPFNAAKKAERKQQDQEEIEKVRQQLASSESPTDKDDIYAEKYWQLRVDRGDKPKLIEGIKQSFRENILNSAQSDNKVIGIFVGGDSFSEDEKGKVSAYRVLARELGYEIGSYKINKSSKTATAEIKKI